MRVILISSLLICAHASSQIVVRVNDANPVSLDVRALAELPRHTALLNDHGKQVSYEGPSLHDVLVRAGLDFGQGLRGKLLSSYVLAIGSDGYEAVYALADFDPSIAAAEIIVADKRNAKPLDAKEGPLRVVAPQDKRPARSVRLLREIDVVQLNK